MTSSTPARWVGPDGITYACESDYRDTWGLLDPVCDRLEAHWRATGNVEALRAAGCRVEVEEGLGQG